MKRSARLRDALVLAATGLSCASQPPPESQPPPTVAETSASTPASQPPSVVASVAPPPAPVTAVSTAPAPAPPPPEKTRPRVVMVAPTPDAHGFGSCPSGTTLAAQCIAHPDTDPVPAVTSCAKDHGISGGKHNVYVPDAKLNVPLTKAQRDAVARLDDPRRLADSCCYSGCASDTVVPFGGATGRPLIVAGVVRCAELVVGGGWG